MVFCAGKRNRRRGVLAVDAQAKRGIGHDDAPAETGAPLPPRSS
jgi:hypothetical protein